MCSFRFEKLEPALTIVFIYNSYQLQIVLFTQRFQHSPKHRCKISDTPMVDDPLDDQNRQTTLPFWFRCWTRCLNCSWEVRPVRRKTFPGLAEGQIYPGSTGHSVPGTSMCQEAPRLVEQHKKAEASGDV